MFNDDFPVYIYRQEDDGRIQIGPCTTRPGARNYETSPCNVQIFSCKNRKFSVEDLIYTHGNKLGNTCNNVTTNFGLYTSFFVKIMKNVLTICQNL